MEFIYEQDCGTYSVTFEPTDPTCDVTDLLTAQARTVGGSASNINNL